MFKERGATNRTSVLLLQKKTEGMIQDDIFMAIPKHAGELFGKFGHRLPNNLEDVYNDWLEYNKGKTKGFKFSFIVKKEDLENYWDNEEKIYRNRLDPKYYNPRFKKLIKEIEKNKTSQLINELVDFEEETCPEDDVNSFGSKYN